MKHDEIVAIQEKVGAEPDGFWGPGSRRAAIGYLRKLAGPNADRWPVQRSADLIRVFGSAGTNQSPIDVADLDIEYAGNRVARINCNRAVGASLRTILEQIHNSEHAHILRHYAGCFNYRPMRGGSSLSMHAFGIAIDLWPEQNGFKEAWPVSADMPFGVMEIFAKEGWTPAGLAWGRDAMHFQATRLSV